MCVSVCNVWHMFLMSLALAGSVMASAWCPISYWHSGQEGRRGHCQSVHLTNNSILQIRCVHVASGTVGTTVTFLFRWLWRMGCKIVECHPCNILRDLQKCECKPCGDISLYRFGNKERSTNQYKLIGYVGNKKQYLVLTSKHTPRGF